MLTLSDPTLEEYWQTAVARTPMIIVGGGRWGRTWAVAASRARGDCSNISIAARTDPDSVRAWVASEREVAGLEVVTSLTDALRLPNRPVLAVVASRPQDHVRDAKEALSNALDVLVEKPISDNASSGKSLVDFSRQSGKLLGVVTEFALLPSFHYCARSLGEPVVHARLFWDDQTVEVRYGDTKRHHSETSMLVDLLPHAYSIFRIFARTGALRIVALRGDNQHRSLYFQDGSGNRYELHCNKAAAMRRRHLELESFQHRASVEFANAIPRVTVDGRERFNPVTSYMTSTLRLALGSFVTARSGRAAPSPLVDCVDELVALQDQLEGREAR